MTDNSTPAPSDLLAPANALDDALVLFLTEREEPHFEVTACDGVARVPYRYAYAWNSTVVQVGVARALARGSHPAREVL